MRDIISFNVQSNEELKLKQKIVSCNIIMNENYVNLNYLSCFYRRLLKM